MAYENVTYGVRDGVATITLNRPDAYNALGIPLARDLFQATLDADEDPAVRCIVLTGTGKAFCAGGDVKEFARAGASAGRLIKELTTYFHGAVSRLCRAPKPVMVGINGVAAGGGMSLALAGDVVIAAESARLTYAYGRIAASPDGASTYVLPRLIGMRRALDLYFTNRVLSARDAEAWGLVTRVVGDGELGAVLGALAGELAAGPTAAFARTKRLFLGSPQESLETQMELEAQAIVACAHGEDFQRAVAAFGSKEAVTFRGR